MEERSSTVFGKVEGRNTADYLMRTVQQHHVQISQMADTKANILITVSSIVLTVAISQLSDDRLKYALVALILFTLAALLLSIIALLPKLTPVKLRDGKLQEGFNLLFFGHFQALDKDVFNIELARILESDALVYETLADDIYAIGKYLYRWKYRYLRWAYISLLIGFVVASVLGVMSILMI